MWTQEHRRIYRREGRIPERLRDAEWPCLAPLISSTLPGVRPCKTEMRAAMNAIPICCVPTVCGAACREKVSHPARRSTTSFANSSASAVGRRMTGMAPRPDVGMAARQRVKSTQSRRSLPSIAMAARAPEADAAAAANLAITFCCTEPRTRHPDNHVPVIRLSLDAQKNICRAP
jgi:hypothetical protein